MPKIKFLQLDQFGLMTEVSLFDAPKNLFNFASNVLFRNGGIIADHQYINMNEYHFKNLMAPNERIKRVFRFGPHMIYITNYCVYCSTLGIDSRGEVGYKVPMPDKSFKGLDDGKEAFGLRVGKYFMITLGKGAPFIVSLSQPCLAKEVPGWIAGYEVDGGLALINNIIVCAGRHDPSHTYNNKIFWSNFAYDDEMPTLWDPTVVENNSAGFITFAEFNKIYGIYKSGDALIIYSDNGTKNLQYTGGDDIFMNRDLLEHDFPVKGFGCVTRTRKGHVMVTNDDVVVHNGIQATSLINNIRSRILDVLRAEETDIKVMYMSHRDELFIAYKPNLSYFYENAFVCSMTDSPKWSSTTFPPVADFIYDKDIYNNTVTLIDDLQGTIDDLYGSIDQLGSVLDKYALFALQNYNPLRLFLSNETSIPRDFEVSKEFIDFDEMGASHEQVKQVLAIYPQAFLENQKSELNFYIGVSNTSQGSISWQTSLKFLVGGIKDKVDFRTSGKYVSFRITGKSAQPVNISLFLMDYNIRSGR